MHVDQDQLVAEAAELREGTMALEVQRGAAALRAKFPTAVLLDADLSQLSQWRVGGRALAVFRPGSVAELAAGLT